MLVGSLLSGVTVDYFKGNWPAFWLSSAAMSFVILLMILFFFRSSEKIEQKAVA